MTTDTMPRARRPKVASLLSEFGPTLDAFLMVARAHHMLRQIALTPQADPALDKLMKRRVRKIETATKTRMEAVKRRDWKAASAAASEIRKASRELQTLRETQLAAMDQARATLEASLMATIRGEETEDAEVTIADWLKDENGARKIKRGRAILVEETAKVRRIMARTGLRLALDKGYLDGGKVSGAALYAMGLRYREKFEMVSVTGLGTTGEERIGTPRCKPSVGPADKVLEAARDLANLRLGLTRRQRVVLDVVCGRDESVKIAARAIGSGVPAAKKALVAGLVTVWQNRSIG
mgnify:CR=1 FL=1